MALAVLLPILLAALPGPAAALPATFVPPPILMYHRIDVDRPAGALARELTVNPHQLRAQLDYFKRRGIAVISMADLDRRLERREPLDRAVVLTFDDGYADQFRYAVPLLRQYGDSATFYVVTGELGRPHHLTWAQLRAMLAQHLDVAAHGVYHDDLSQMTPAQQRFEIEDSVERLRADLHAPVDSYAYPSGRFTRETLTLVNRADVALGVTTDSAYVLPPENRLEMTRLRVRGQWRIGDFASAVLAAMRKERVVLR